MKHILVSGSTGQLGSELKGISHNYNGYHFHFKNRLGLDLSNEESIKRVFQNKYFDFFINTAAYTSVDAAESDKESCKLTNATALEIILKYINTDCQIIHLSTDYVYNNNTDQELLESHDTNPLGVYATTKLLGENILLKNHKNTIIIRTSWVYSTFGQNFVKTMLRLGKNNNELTIVDDQIGSPTYAFDIAECIMNIINHLSNTDQRCDLYGIYNFSNSGQTNWADFATEIFRLKNIDCKVKTTTTEKYNAPAHRPLWSVMSKKKIVEKFGLELKDWKSRLASCLSKL